MKATFSYKCLKKCEAARVLGFDAAGLKMEMDFMTTYPDGAAPGQSVRDPQLVRQFFDDFSNGKVAAAFSRLSDTGTWRAAGTLFSGDRRIMGEFSKAEYSILSARSSRRSPRVSGSTFSP